MDTDKLTYPSAVITNNDFATFAIHFGFQLWTQLELELSTAAAAAAIVVLLLLVVGVGWLLLLRVASAGCLAGWLASLLAVLIFRRVAVAVNELNSCCHSRCINTTVE